MIKKACDAEEFAATYGWPMDKSDIFMFQNILHLFEIIGSSIGSLLHFSHMKERMYEFIPRRRSIMSTIMAYNKYLKSHMSAAHTVGLPYNVHFCSRCPTPPSKCVLLLVIIIDICLGGAACCTGL
jgi:hypothetical protein